MSSVIKSAKLAQYDSILSWYICCKNLYHINKGCSALFTISKTSSVW